MRIRHSFQRHPPATSFAVVATPSRVLKSTSILMFMILQCHSPEAMAQQPEPSTESTEQDPALSEMRQRISKLVVTRKESQQEVPLELVDAPLLRFSDPSREFGDGTLWAWSRNGRPLVLVAIERYPERWSYELISLLPIEDPAAVSVRSSSGRRWMPDLPGIVLQPLEDAPPRAGSESARQLQLRDLARQFTLSEVTYQEQRYELRLMPTAVHRYQPPEQPGSDGACFVYANGTNPEALLILECRAGGDNTKNWFFAFVPLTSVAVTARRGEREVWTKPLGPRGPWTQTPYAAFSEPVADPASEPDS